LKNFLENEPEVLKDHLFSTLHINIHRERERERERAKTEQKGAGFHKQSLQSLSMISSSFLTLGFVTGLNPW
jgi:hypothetical protein